MNTRNKIRVPGKHHYTVRWVSVSILDRGDWGNMLYSNLLIFNDTQYLSHRKFFEYSVHILIYVYSRFRVRSAQAITRFARGNGAPFAVLTPPKQHQQLILPRHFLR